MSRDWKPGDLAAVKYGPVMRIRHHHEDGKPGWVFASDGSFIAHYPGDDPRPLVVIDPEDREQVERLAAARYGRGFYDAYLHIRDAHITDMQTALREFSNPTPSIDEPTELFAVVEDKGGDQWCHIGEGVWRSLTSTGQYMVEKHWHDNYTPLAGNVVRVLSEGIQ